MPSGSHVTATQCMHGGNSARDTSHMYTMAGTTSCLVHTPPLSPFASASSPASWKLLGPHLCRPEVRQIHFHQRCRAAKVYASGDGCRAFRTQVWFSFDFTWLDFIWFSHCALCQFGEFFRKFSLPFCLLSYRDSIHTLSLCAVLAIFFLAYLPAH